MQLVSGLSLLPVLIGFFSVSQVFMLLDKATLEGKVHSVKSIRDTLPSMTQLLRMKYLYLKSAVIGTVIGILPGAGSEISSFIAYREAKRGSKTPEKFGTGTMEGVAAPECANNATVPASLIPLLTLGIPGSPTAAVMFGALLIHNLTPGRTLFTEQAETTYTLIFGIILASALMAILGILIAKWASKIVLCPNEILGPLILNLCFVGAFAAAHNLFDVYVAFGFGIIGYVLRKVGFDGAPAVLGFVLGPIAERGLRQALILGRGDLTYLFASPISKVLILLALLSLCAPYISLMIKKNKAGAKF
jgi:putative tricarboxylic transport membrane protein